MTVSFWGRILSLESALVNIAASPTKRMLFVDEVSKVGTEKKKYSCTGYMGALLRSAYSLTTLEGIIANGQVQTKENSKPAKSAAN